MKESLLDSLNRTLQIACKSTFYKKRGIISHINALSEFESILPTTKEELRESEPYEQLSADLEVVHSGMMKAMGAVVIAISRGSLVTPYPRVLEIMKRVKATVLACNPSEAIILADIAVRLGYDL